MNAPDDLFYFGTNSVVGATLQFHALKEKRSIIITYDGPGFVELSCDIKKAKGMVNALLWAIAQAEGTEYEEDEVE